MKYPLVKKLFWAAMALVLLGCGQQMLMSEQVPKTIDLVYMGNLDGELEPCGCSLEGNLGGVLRQATTIDQWRAASQDLFLLSSGGLVVSHTPHDRTTGEFILKGYGQLGFDAIGVQWQDRAYGDDFMQGHDLPWVSSNSGGAFPAYKEIERGGVTLAVFSWLDYEAMKDAQAMMATSENDEVAMQRLRSHLKQAKANGLTTVMMSTLTLEAAKQKLPMAHIDILLIKSSYEVYGEPMLDNSTLVLQPGSRGMRFAYLKAELDASSGSIASYRHEVISMPPDVADAERLAGWYDAYNNRLKADYQASVALKKKMKAEGSPYAGAKACKACHADEYATWRKTKHAKAYRKLLDVNKAFDPVCIKCHVVGFEKPGGFIDPELTRKLENVQCESCHGAAAEHAASAGTKPVENKTWAREEMCAQCHVKKHSPSFNLDEYWSRVSH